LPLPRFGVRSRPISRVLSWTVIPLDNVSPRASSDLPGNTTGRRIVPLFDLAADGVCHATRRWPRARCALTAPFHPCLRVLAQHAGGLLSVALSVGSRRPDVIWHPALCSPDFPRCLRTATVWPTSPAQCSGDASGHEALPQSHSVGAPPGATHLKRGRNATGRAAPHAPAPAQWRRRWSGHSRRAGPRGPDLPRRSSRSSDPRN
jgi:hypothetical protein